MKHQLLQGDCLEVLQAIKDNSIDAVVTDPPYGLRFMGKNWDLFVPSIDIWREVLRVLKPGGHLLSFAGTRTQHRMAVNIEDAGFEIRDMIAWVYGSGFPKSLDVSKAIDKEAGAERKVVIGSKLGRAGMAKDGSNQSFNSSVNTYGSGGVLSTDITAPATEAAKQWQGFGTALKPALEPITVARKPIKGTVAANVQEYGTGALNIDGCRIGTDVIKHSQNRKSFQKWKELDGRQPKHVENPEPTLHTGRFPANLIHDGSDEVTELFPSSTACGYRSNISVPDVTDAHTWKLGRSRGERGYLDSGSAARFFYCAKASKADRGDNHHPTVKPTDLMRYLCRLVTPPNGIILDPFTGSGSTGKAAMLEGFRFVGIERDWEYIAIAQARIKAALHAMPLLAFA